MNKLLKNIITWVKDNSGRLLLYAVILTGCFSIKFAAYGKYADYVKDYTSATAAPFYFGSNYLGDISDGKSYVIGTFNGEEYELDIEVRNNDNAFNFDEKPQDFYYYVSAEMFKDAAYTIPYKSDNYTTFITYGKNNEYAAGMAKMVKTYEYATVSEIIEVSGDESGNDNGGSGLVNGDNGTDGDGKTYITEDYYRLMRAKDIVIDSNTPQTYQNNDKYRLVGYLPGLESSSTDGNTAWADVTNDGKQTVRIRIAWNGSLPTDTEDKAIYLKVTAHTIPACTINDTSSKTSIFNITKEAFGDDAEIYFPSGYTNHYTGGDSFPNLSSSDSVFDPDYDKETGIYDTELVGKFKLAETKSKQDVDIKRSFSYSKTDYAVMYTFYSNVNTPIKIYYDSEKMQPDASLGTPVAESKEKDDKSGYYTHYLTAELYANGSKSCYFYKKTLDTSVSEYDALAVETEDTESVE